MLTGRIVEIRCDFLLDVLLNGNQSDIHPRVDDPFSGALTGAFAQDAMTADQADHAAGCGIADRSDGRLDRSPSTAKREAMANSELCSLGKTGAESFANGPGVFPAQTGRDVHLPDFLRRDAKNRFKRRVYPLVRKSPPVRRAYCKEKIGCKHPV
jgi:hypothetical protein